MPQDFAQLFAITLSFAVTFVAARLLSRKWRARRRAREEQERRAGESRQVRRARERRQKP